MTNRKHTKLFSIRSQASGNELVEELKNAIQYQLRLILARDLGSSTKSELWMATSLAVREMMIDRFIDTQKEITR